MILGKLKVSKAQTTRINKLVIKQKVRDTTHDFVTHFIQDARLTTVKKWRSIKSLLRANEDTKVTEPEFQSKTKS